MTTPLKAYTADHRYLLEVVGRQAGFATPVAIDLDEFDVPLLRVSRKRELLPIDGVLVRDWDPDNRRIDPGMRLGLRIYEIEGIRFARVQFPYNDQQNCWGLNFVAVDRQDYRRLYRIALRCRRDLQPPSTPPVLPQEQIDSLWQNTIGYLDRGNLRRIKSYGGRAK